MNFAELTEKQKKIIGECLDAAANGPFFPEWEFSTLFGLERSEVAKIAKDWPNIDLDGAFVDLAINNALCNLWGYPIDKESAWDSLISVSRSEVGELLALYQGEDPSDSVKNSDDRGETLNS